MKPTGACCVVDRRCAVIKLAQRGIDFNSVCATGQHTITDQEVESDAFRQWVEGAVGDA